jgi:hypothetical protein
LRVKSGKERISKFPFSLNKKAQNDGFGGLEYILQNDFFFTSPEAVDAPTMQEVKINITPLEKSKKTQLFSYVLVAEVSP